MRALSVFFVCSAVASPTLPMLAQNPPPRVDRPTAPWVGPLPERGAWKIQVVNSAQPKPPGEEVNASKPGNSEITEIESMTWNAVKRDIFRFSDSTQKTVFYYAGFALVEGQSSKGRPAPVLVQQLPGTDYNTFRSAGWLGMEWLNEGYFKGIVPFTSPVPGGAQESVPTQCFYYRKPPGPLAGSDEWLPELKAWVRVQDLYPVAVAMGDRLFVFAKQVPPSAAPELSQEQASKLLELKDQYERKARLVERNKRLRKE